LLTSAVSGIGHRIHTTKKNSRFREQGHTSDTRQLLQLAFAGAVLPFLQQHVFFITDRAGLAAQQQQVQ